MVVERFSGICIHFLLKIIWPSFIVFFVFQKIKTVLIGINRAIFPYCFSLSPTIWGLSHNKGSLRICVKRYKHEIEFCSAPDCSFSPHESRGVYELGRLLLVDDLIFHTYLVSGYIFPSGKWFTTLEAAVPNFLDRCKLMLHPPFLIPILCCVAKWKVESTMDQTDLTVDCIFFMFGAF